jgi:hypothetical protein
MDLFRPGPYRHDGGEGFHGLERRDPIATWSVMFFFRHPKPVVDRRAVAEHAVQIEQPALPMLEALSTSVSPEEEAARRRPDLASVQGSGMTGVLPLPGAGEARGPAVGSPVDEPPITFRVRYRFSEYRSMVEDHMPTAMRELGRTPGKPNVLSTFALRVFLWGLFQYKQSRVGECRFEIDAEGLTRHAKGREKRFAWSEIAALHRYREGYIVALAKGGMPLPHRCLFDGESERMERWWRAAASRERAD